jgi:hypothetical protein
MRETDLTQNDSDGVTLSKPDTPFQRAVEFADPGIPSPPLAEQAPSARADLR